ncbi:hypothetical protein HPB47_011799 [Ixodes persulcatus]|uniref:Uncharacterized protein n=1 Tax=Ixodes persulcatus TaxID=34615 RepID=A0AC60NV70_IXOPE|nr:hypothetical protein HPB47_011799 [Ixodes persulcatus]
MAYTKRQCDNTSRGFATLCEARQAAARMTSKHGERKLALSGSVPTLARFHLDEHRTGVRLWNNYRAMHSKDPRAAAVLHGLNFSSGADAPDWGLFLLSTPVTDRMAGPVFGTPPPRLSVLFGRVFKAREGWAGVQCEQSTTCKGFCFNHGTCLPSPQDDELPSCLCARGFTGLRCQTSLSQGVAHSDRSAASDSLPNLLGAILIPVVVIVSVAVLLVLAVLIYRKRKRSRPFHHVRMQESSAGTGNVEISNPIYLRGDCEDDAAEALNASFSLDPDKATNFSNPVYDSLYADGAVNGEEKKGLLQGDLQVDYLDSQGPLRGDHPLA